MRIMICALAFVLPIHAFAGLDEAIQAYNSMDYDRALTEFRPLAEQGNAIAQFSMASIYHYGYGVARSESDAVKWYRMAAEQGHALAQYYLAMAYAKGQGVGRDLVAAHMWFDISADHAANVRDAVYARQERNKLESEMSAEEVAQAKKLASEWKPRAQ